MREVSPTIDQRTEAGHSLTAGFSMTEALIALAILSILGGAIVSIFQQSQAAYRAQTDQAQRIQQMRIALDQMTRTIRQAGNDPLNRIGTPAVSWLGENILQVVSDITGTDPSASGDPLRATGDPDGNLSALYEVVTFRYDPAAQMVYSNVGYGEELLAERITSMDFSFFDMEGNLTENPSEIASVRVLMVGESMHPDSNSGLTRTVTLESDTFLRCRIPSVTP